MKNSKNKKNVILTRDNNILLSQKREISLITKTVKDKKKYTRKSKYKNKIGE